MLLLEVQVKVQLKVIIIFGLFNNASIYTPLSLHTHTRTYVYIFDKCHIHE